MTRPKDAAAQPGLAPLVDALLESYRSDPRATRVGRRFMPSPDAIISTTNTLLHLMYPGYHGRQDLTQENVAFHVGHALDAARRDLLEQVTLCQSYQEEVEGHPHDGDACETRAEDVVDAFLARLPAVRALLLQDVQAAYDGDPAARNLDEIILAYPGLLAISVYRLAHELHVLGVQLMPRIMTEWAHAMTGADIHPGAEIGPSFFLDHATGAVIGETTRIGSNVKLYQGVTLGALSFPKDESGRVIRGTKRHPTVEDGVTIYANATVLGGTTVLGKGALVGGSVFLTQSVPAGARVAIKAPELQVKTADRRDDGAPESHS
jgi:serine O-acetyltransferase